MAVEGHRIRAYVAGVAPLGSPAATALTVSHKLRRHVRRASLFPCETPPAVGHAPRFMKPAYRYPRSPGRFVAWSGSPRRSDGICFASR